MAFLSALTSATPGASQNLQTTKYGPTLDSALQNYNGATSGQNDLLAQLKQTASGQGGPNAADQELLTATQRNAAANAAAVASQRGITNPQLAGRQALGTTAALNQEEAGQAAEARLQQQILAQQQEAQILGQQEQGGIGLFGAGASGQNAQNAGQLQNQELAQKGHEADLGAAGGLLQGIANTAAGPLGSGAWNGLSSWGKSGPGPDQTLSEYGAKGGGIDAGTVASLAAAGAALAHGGDVHELTPLRQQFLQAYCKAHGGDIIGADDVLAAFNAGKEHAESMKDGGEVRGPPAPYPGDDPRNDSQPRILSVGEHVVPRSVAQAPYNRELMAELDRQERAAKVMHATPGAMLPTLLRRRA